MTSEEKPTPEALTRGYIVYVDDNFHFMNEDERYCAGRFASYEQALEVAKGIVLEFFSNTEFTGTAEAILASYHAFGEDPFIVPFGGAAPPEEMFSAWKFAETEATRIAAMKHSNSPRQ